MRLNFSWGFLLLWLQLRLSCTSSPFRKAIYSKWKYLASKRRANSFLWEYIPFQKGWKTQFWHSASLESALVPFNWIGTKNQIIRLQDGNYSSWFKIIRRHQTELKWIKFLQTPFPLGFNNSIYKECNISKMPDFDSFSLLNIRKRKHRSHGLRKKKGNWKRKNRQ